MKICNDNPSALTNATDAVEPTTDQTAATGKPQAPLSQTDQVTLSPEARILKAIANSAAEPLAIRQDVVDRMRALLDRGAIGEDPRALADAIIDDSLTLP